MSARGNAGRVGRRGRAPATAPRTARRTAQPSRPRGRGRGGGGRQRRAAGIRACGPAMPTTAASAPSPKRRPMPVPIAEPHHDVRRRAIRIRRATALPKRHPNQATRRPRRSPRQSFPKPPRRSDRGGARPCVSRCPRTGPARRRTGIRAAPRAADADGRTGGVEPGGERERDRPRRSGWWSKRVLGRS